LLDPTLEESKMCDGFLTIGMNVYGDICLINKPGGKELG
jgi:hypothetical protein